MITPEDFYSDQPPGRIMGGENENDVQNSVKDKNGDDLPPDEVLQRSIKGIISLGAANLKTHKCIVINDRDGKFGYTEVWLDNGALIYPELGLGEYSGPEVVGPRKAAAADKAGVFAFNDLVEASGIEHRGIYRRSGSVKQLYISPYRTVYTTKTNGYHRNFLFPTSLFHNAEIRVGNTLASLTAVNAWDWNGMLAEDGFEWSQKHRGIGKAHSTNMDDRTVEGGKPIVMFRNVFNEDNDVNPNSRWSRAEIRALDPGQNLAGMYLGYAALSLALRLLEHAEISGSHLEKLQLARPVGAMKAVARDITLGVLLEMSDGRRLTGDNILEGYAEAYEHLSERIDLPKDEQTAIPLMFQTAEWQRGVRDGNIKDFSLICSGARKLMLVRQRFDDHELTITNSQAHQMDFMFDRNDNFGKDSNKVGYGRKLAEHTPRYRDFDAQYVPPELVKHFYHHADDESRSSHRAEYVEGPAQTNTPTKIHWAGYQPDGEDALRQWEYPYRDRAEAA